MAGIDGLPAHRDTSLDFYKPHVGSYRVGQYPEAAWAPAGARHSGNGFVCSGLCGGGEVGLRLRESGSRRAHCHNLEAARSAEILHGRYRFQEIRLPRGCEPFGLSAH